MGQGVCGGGGGGQGLLDKGEHTRTHLAERSTLNTPPPFVILLYMLKALWLKDRCNKGPEMHTMLLSLPINENNNHDNPYPFLLRPSRYAAQRSLQR